MGRKLGGIMTIAIASGLLALSATTSRGAVTLTGDAYNDTNAPPNFQAGNISGKTGGLVIDSASTLNNGYAYLGYQLNSTGTATISGTGSVWNNTFLYIGEAGSGNLNITNGGVVSSGSSYFGLFSGSTGTATISGTGSVWNISNTLAVSISGSATLNITNGGVVTVGKILYADPVNLQGNGTIYAQGAVLDANLTFDQTHGLTQTLPFGSGGTLNLTISSTGTLGVGYKRAGSLLITGGREVSSSSGELGHSSGSTGTATVSGSGSKWNISGNFYIGYSGSGTFNITNGGKVSTNYGYLGGTMSTATINGSGSVWNISKSLEIGHSGSGTINITDGGVVSAYDSDLGQNSGSTGTVNINGPGSVWNLGHDLHIGYFGSGTLNVTNGGLVTVQGTLWANPANLYGNGTITVSQGAVLDANLTFDQTHGLTQTLPFGSGGTLNLTISSGATLGVGNQGSGSLLITGGRVVSSYYGQLGFTSGSTGTATVSGTGAKWNIGRDFNIGNYGNGNLNITNGGVVSSYDCYLGFYSSSTGIATIRGTSSVWNSGYLYLGTSGSGTLNITNGGMVSSIFGVLCSQNGSTATVNISGPGSVWNLSSGLSVGVTPYVCRATINISDGGRLTTTSIGIQNNSSLRLQVSGNGMVVLGNATTNGSLTNAATILLYADAFLTSGTYSPITAYPGKSLTFTNNGTINTFGGTWNSSTKTFSVTSVASVYSGSPMAVTSYSRFLITDPTTQHHLGLAFSSVTANTNLVAVPSSTTELGALQSLIAPHTSVLAGWDLSTNQSAILALVSFDIGTGQENLQIWSLNQGTWSQLTPDLETYDVNGHLSFTVSELSSAYAVTATIPEPATGVLLGLGVIGLLTRRRH